MFVKVHVTSLVTVANVDLCYLITCLYNPDILAV